MREEKSAIGRGTLVDPDTKAPYDTTNPQDFSRRLREETWRTRFGKWFGRFLSTFLLAACQDIASAMDVVARPGTLVGILHRRALRNEWADVAAGLARNDIDAQVLAEFATMTSSPGAAAAGEAFLSALREGVRRWKEGGQKTPEELAADANENAPRPASGND